MTDYRRFISYVYEYRQGKKQGNCGFIKIEIKNGTCILEIHLRLKKNMGGKSCGIYAFVRKNDLLEGILLKEYAYIWDKVEGLLEISQNDVGKTGLPLEKIGGIVFVSEGGFWGTEWDDRPIRPENFCKMQADYILETAESETDSETELEIEIDSDVETESETKAEMENEEKSVLKNSELYEGRKIILSDLLKISDECYRLRFNRFLLYGYHSVGHLLLAKRADGRYILGVPGYYDQQESFMAGMFGFPYFLPQKDPDIVSEKKAGYWYRLIEEPNN